jgi:site-specific DNA-methyltransferase (adenine-specific)
MLATAARALCRWGQPMSAESFLDGRVALHCGDSREVLKTLPDNSIDAVVTDPPYSLVSVVKRFANSPRSENTENIANPYGRTGRGFMGQRWDNGEVAFDPAFWAEVLRVLKPGGHVLAMGGTRTYHRLACAIEDAGFEIRDTVMWVYGSGFPKSHDVSKGIDRMGGQPWSTFARLLDDLIKRSGFNYTTLDVALGIPSAGSNSCYWVRVDERGGLPPRRYCEKLRELLSPPPVFMDLYDKAEREVIALERRKNAPSGIVSAGRASIEVEREITIAATDAARQWDGWGTALKPCHEDVICAQKPYASSVVAASPAVDPCVLARKPLSEGTVAANVMQWGTGAINIDECRISGEPWKSLTTTGLGSVKFFTEGEIKRIEKNPHDLGRWPANLIHDGSPEVLAAFPDNLQSGKEVSRSEKTAVGYRPNAFGAELRPAGVTTEWYGDSGSAARFFYEAKPDGNGRDGEASAERRYTDEGATNFAALPGARREPIETHRLFYSAKADEVDRAGSTHPTIKPVDLIQYLIRLITPPGGTVLDPFAGTGTTGEAAFREGMRAVLIEREPEYQADIRRRMALVLAGPAERARESVKARGKVESAGPLFDGL